MSAAVVLMAYGSPERLEDVRAYYEDIRGGRPIRRELLDELVERYRTLGIEDANPLNRITEETRTALEEELGLPVFTGMKHWRPRIAEAAEQALTSGADTIVGIVLAPHYSRLSIGGYRAQLESAVGDRAALLFLDSWHDDPAFIDLLAARVRAALSSPRLGAAGKGGRRIVPPAASGDGEAGLLTPESASHFPGAPKGRPAGADAGQGCEAHVVFTAHSLPARILAEGDPYQEQLLETCHLVARAAGLDHWSFSYQSESDTGEPWLQPDLLDYLAELSEREIERVLVCPVGFVSDHLEIWWDIDTEAKARAQELGLDLDRIAMPNADPELVRVLAGIVRRLLSVPSRA